MDVSVLELNGEPMKQTASIDTEGAKLVFDLQGAGDLGFAKTAAALDPLAEEGLAQVPVHLVGHTSGSRHRRFSQVFCDGQVA